MISPFFLSHPNLNGAFWYPRRQSCAGTALSVPPEELLEPIVENLYSDGPRKGALNGMKMINSCNSGEEYQIIT